MDLGCLCAYVHDYGTLGGSDYFTGMKEGFCMARNGLALSYLSKRDGYFFVHTKW